MIEVFQAVDTAFQGAAGADLRAVVGATLPYGEAPQGTKVPFLVISPVADTPMDTLGETVDRLDVRITVYSSSVAQAFELVSLVQSFMKNEVTIDGESIGFVRTFKALPRKQGEAWMGYMDFKTILIS